jgi:hypothetical protein
VALKSSSVRPKHKYSAFRVAIAILALCLIVLPANRAVAYEGRGTLPTVGTVDGYMRQGEPRDSPYAGQPYSGSGGQGLYGSPRAGAPQQNAAVMGAMIVALWALQRYQERHLRHPMRNYRGVARSRHHNRINQMPFPLGYGF